MKHISLLFALALGLLMPSCKKDPIENEEGRVGISRITYFPVFDVTGDAYIAIPTGATFTEPGVTATEGGTALTVTTTGTVDVNSPGVYKLIYSAINKDGFAATAFRYVIVYSTDASAAANDFSGTYLRGATGVNSYWTKLAPGVYKVDNPGGAASGGTLSIVVFNATGNTIHAPEQVATDGNTVSTSNETYSLTPSPRYSWVFLHPGYGTGLRTFVKQ